MTKERTFQPPQTVLDIVAERGDSGVVPLTRGPIPISELRKMHSFLRAENIAKTAQWEDQGGNAGLMWAHRVLRQQGVLKSSTVGDVFIPELIDMQLGPNIIVGHAREDMGELVTKFHDKGIPSTFIPTEDGSFVFFAEDVSLAYQKSKNTTLPSFPDVPLSDVVVVDESQSKISSILKSGKNNVTGVRCEHLEAYVMPVEADWDAAYLLKTLDFVDQAVKILKVDEELGLVLGWAIVCTVDGVEYFDKQGDYIPDYSMLDAATDFMLNSRVAKEMHTGDEKGTVVFAWPMTAEIAKAFGIETSQTGLMIAMKPDNPEMLEKFRDGTYNGFSIGGHRIPSKTEEVE